MAAPLPDPSEINVEHVYTVTGTSYKGLIQTAVAVRNATGLSGIEVKVSDARLTVGLAGTEDPLNTNGLSLTWSVQPVNVCINNNSSVIYILAGVPDES